MATTVLLSLVSYYLLTGFILLECIPKTLYNIRMINFKRKHPDFDINIDVNELKKELEKYEKISKRSNDTEKKKEEHYINFNEDFKQMNDQEKLDFLQKELEFWKNVSREEKNIELLSETKKENIQKTIGTIK